MRVVVPQIAWHNRDPVLSIDIDPSCKGEDGYYRVATGGADTHVLVWRLSNADTFKPDLNCMSELKRHEKPVNVVRFTSDGSLLASGGDDAYIILWKCGEKSEAEETWIFEKSLRKHIEDVADLSWSPDGEFLVSASIDNSAVLWDIKKGVAIHVWNEKEHSGFVHGVCYDPLHEFVATMCIDRNLRFFDRKTNKIAHKALKYPDTWITPEIKEKDVPVVEEKENVENAVDDTSPDKLKKPNAANAILNRLFHDEFLPTFCRRLSFSPKGELLMVPAGMLPPGLVLTDPKQLDEQNEEQSNNGTDTLTPNTDEDKKKKKIEAGKNNNAVILFCRHSWTSPCAIIPTFSSYSIGSKFCPIYFKTQRTPYNYDEEYMSIKKNERKFACVNKIAPGKVDKHCLMKMPYRLVYAVATNDSVLIGDTASSEPLAVIRSIHLARISDITWSSNGRSLLVSSTDGYCSIITFEEGELGQEFCMDENFPTLTKDCFPILPPEPKKEKVVKKKEKKHKPKIDGDLEVKGSTNIIKTPTNSGAGKKPVIKAKTPVNVLIAKSAKTKLSPLPSSPPVNGEGKPKLPEAESQMSDTGTKALSSTTEFTSSPPKGKTPQTQKATLHKWFSKTPKTDDSPKTDKTKTPRSSNPPPKNVVSAAEPEVITVDDSSQEEAEMLTPSFANAASNGFIYPMTPPVAKAIAIRRIAPSPVPVHSPCSQPESIASSSPMSKKRPGDVSPEELEKLTTLPIKYRKTMEEPVILMESSSQESKEAYFQSESKKVPSIETTVSQSPKLSDANCPPSPVSSTGGSKTPRPPRRITLTTLATKPSTGTGNLE